MLFLKQLFTWWNGQTLNTRFYTWRKGEQVGTDQAGNRYYRAKSALPRVDSRAPLGDLQRLFGSLRRAARLAWLDASPRRPAATGWRLSGRANGKSRIIANQTGTANAYRPPGSIVSGAKPAARAADYSAWKPE